MRLYGSLLCVLLVASVASSVDPTAPVPTSAVTLDLGAPITVDVGKKCILTAETTAKKVTWEVPEGVDYLDLDGKRLAVWALPGSYIIRGSVPSGDDVVSKKVVLTVTGARPPPPVDTLQEQAQKAYDAAPAATRAADKVTMAAVFTALVPAMDDPGVKTAKQLYDLNAAAMFARLNGRLGGVGQVFATDFGTIFPTKTLETYTLTTADREAAKTKLARYAAVLKEVK